jgi:hypothetical protein
MILERCNRKCPWWTDENTYHDCNRHHKEINAVKWVGSFPDFCDLAECEYIAFEDPERIERKDTR